MKRNRNLSIIFIIVGYLLLCSVGCRSVKLVSVTPSLPNFNPIRPVRPVLDPIPDDAQISTPILINTVKQMSYARQLEEYADGWERYYKKLKILFGGQEEDAETR